MGSAVSRARCETPNQPSFDDDPFKKDVDLSSKPLAPPPPMMRPKSFDEKLFEKFTKQPLVPIGCAATVYFLFSGIKSFKNREPRRAQKMMRARVGAQFATLMAFIGYMGIDQFNFEVAPRYQRYKEMQAAMEAQKKEQQEGSANAVEKS